MWHLPKIQRIVRRTYSVCADRATRMGVLPKIPTGLRTETRLSHHQQMHFVYLLGASTQEDRRSQRGSRVRVDHSYRISKSSRTRPTILSFDEVKTHRSNGRWQSPRLPHGNPWHTIEIVVVGRQVHDPVRLHLHHDVGVTEEELSGLRRGNRRRQHSRLVGQDGES
jgi:hypothetical protein